MTELDVQLSRTVAAMVATRHARRDSWAATSALVGAWGLLALAVASLLLR